MNIPIQNGATERPGGAASAQENVPDGLRESLSLRGGTESDGTAGSTQTDGDDFARSLACFNV